MRECNVALIELTPHRYCMKFRLSLATVVALCCLLLCALSMWYVVELATRQMSLKTEKYASEADSPLCNSAPFNARS